MKSTAVTRKFLKLYKGFHKGLPPVVVDGKTLDRETQLLLQASKLPDLCRMSVPMARRQVDLLARFLSQVQVDTPLQIRNEVLTLGSNKRRIKIRRYVNEQSESDHTLLYFHGGGWVVGNLDSHDGMCRVLSATSGVEVISVDYPLAPEHPYPAAGDVVLQTFEHYLEKKPAESLLMGGDSAGGHLTVEALLACKKKSLPQPSLQLLIYPTVSGLREPTASLETYGHDFYLTLDTMKWFRNHYKMAKGIDFFEDLSGLAPALVVVAGFDPLLDEGRMLHQALQDHGVRSQYLEFPSLIHGFAQMIGVVKEARRAMKQIGLEIKQNLS